MPMSQVVNIINQINNKSIVSLISMRLKFKKTICNSCLFFKTPIFIVHDNIDASIYNNAFFKNANTETFSPEFTKI